MIKLGGQRSTH
jgi:hypothetical protein